MNNDISKTDIIEIKLLDLNLDENKSIKIEEWLVPNFSLISENTPFCLLKYGVGLDSKHLLLKGKSINLKSNKNGVLEILIKEKSYLNNINEILCKIHFFDSEIYKQVNHSIEQYFFNRFNYEKLINDEFFTIKKWFFNEGDFITKGNPIFSFTSNKNQSIITEHLALNSGYLSIVNYEDKIKQKDIIYKTYENREDWLNNEFFNVPLIIEDNFTKSKIIKWKKVSSIELIQGIVSKSLENNLLFTFSFNYLLSKDYIIFQYSSKEMQLSKGDSISFIFEGNEIIEFIVYDNPYKILETYLRNQFETKCLINYDELLIFKEKKCLNWKIRISSTNREIIGGKEGYFKYNNYQNLIAVINKLAKDYISIIYEEIPNYTPIKKENILKDESNEKTNEICFVYLMVDKVNLYYKIGISNNPVWREKTLQSEKPTIELLAAKKFVNRIIALSFEKALHNSYAKNRIRGEWFNLNEKEVIDLKTTLLN
jgi:hypothetical protein